MAQAVSTQRKGFNSLNVYLMVPEVAQTIQFIQHVFEGELCVEFKRKDGSIMHAEMKIGDSMIMMGEPMEPYGTHNASMYIYVDDCDTVYTKAIDAGGTSVMPPTTMQHAGERYGGVIDQAGNLWWIATHIEDVSAEEEARRIKESGL